MLEETAPPPAATTPTSQPKKLMKTKEEEAAPSSSPTQNNNNDDSLTWSEKWTRMISSFMNPILRGLLKLSLHAATNPKSYVVGIAIGSIAILLIGLSTNFNIEAQGDIWTPQNTRSVQHGDWITDTEVSGFIKPPRRIVLVVHRNGKNILGDSDNHEFAKTGVTKVFQVMDTLRTTPGYESLCLERNYVHPVTNQSTCDIIGITTKWNDNTTLFEQEIQTNQDAVLALSAKKYPSGRAVYFDQIIGYNRCARQQANGQPPQPVSSCQLPRTILTSAQSYLIYVGLPGQEELEDDVFDLEEAIITRFKDLREEWANDNAEDFVLEFLLSRSFDDEMLRGINADVPLLPLVFILMSILCVCIYSRRDPVLSRAWLGFGAVVTVLLAIMGSFGLLFAIGVPFTNLTPILPFIMFGVGLDNAFIISGSWSRTDHTLPEVERVTATIQDIGGTIMLTTLTASAAFVLGLVSSVPAVKYLVMYAFPTILVDLLYQVIFFVPLTVLDERRIKANRRDCCFCCASCTDTAEESQAFRLEEERNPQKHFADRAMLAYGKFLLTPTVKGIVVVVFTVMFAVFAYSTAHLEQYFDFTEIMPKDSYILGWWDAFNDYNENNGVVAGIYFRDVDFAKTETRNAMKDYVQDLVDMPYAGTYPTYNFWLLDFESFIVRANLTELDFDQQLQLFLSVDIYNEAHGENIVLDENGTMTASRSVLRYDNLDLEDIKEVVDALELQEKTSVEQPVNHNLKDWAFFTWSDDYYIWEFYKVSPEELILSTLLGTASVSFLALLFIPHWSAVFIVFFMLAVLYIDLMGFVQFCGVNVGPVMYISMVMSIGLMVDYVMHVTFRFMEVNATTRAAKTLETLETIGASVMLGAFSTLIGVLPLGFSQSEIFFTVFVVFFGLVLLGLLHGLVLLPVLLSLIGPLVVLDSSAGVLVETPRGQEPPKEEPTHRSCQSYAGAVETFSNEGEEVPQSTDSSSNSSPHADAPGTLVQNFNWDDLTEISV